MTCSSPLTRCESATQLGKWTKLLSATAARSNFSLPIGPHARRDIEPSAPWPHIDQQPDPVECAPCSLALAATAH